MATSSPGQRELGLSWRGNFKFHYQENSPHPFPHCLSDHSSSSISVILPSSARGEVLRLARMDGKDQCEKQWCLHSYWAIQRSVLIVELLSGSSEPCSVHHWGKLWGSRTVRQQSPTTAIPGGLVTDFPGNGIQSWGSKTSFFGLCRMVGVTPLKQTQAQNWF